MGQLVQGLQIVHPTDPRETRTIDLDQALSVVQREGVWIGIVLPDLKTLQRIGRKSCVQVPDRKETRLLCLARRWW